MKITKVENISKGLNEDEDNLNQFHFKLNKIYCSFHLKKNGIFIYYPLNNYNEYLCIINGFTYSHKMLFPNIYCKNEDEIIQKLLILKYTQKKDIKYIKLNNLNSLNKSVKNETLIFIYNNDIKYYENNILDLFFIIHIDINYTKYIKYINKNIINYLTFIFLCYKIQHPNLNNNKIFIIMFYSDYIKHFYFTNELMKINKKIGDFPNYHELYLFLKRHGYIDKFYNIFIPKVLKKYKIFYKKILNEPNITDFKDNLRKKIKNFSDINLLKIIDTYVDDKFNKKYIKNKFIELSKKI